MDELERPWKLAVLFILGTIYQSSADAEGFTMRESKFRGRVRQHLASVR